MAFTDPSTPNLADFYTYVIGQGVSVTALPANSAYLAYALNRALEVALPGPGIGAGIAGLAGSYVMAVYNLGLHYLIKITPDQPGQTYFVQLRTQLKLAILRPGVTLASEDQGTSETLVVPEFFRGLTLSELDLLKTPYGQEYLSYAQMYGPNITGSS